ncbi:hypothetical protein [Aliikangiella sp. IMCC44632]
MRRLTFLCFMFLGLSVQAATYDISPFKSTNDLIWDEGFQKHITEYFGKKQHFYFWKGATIAEQVTSGFGGPPRDIVKVSENTYFASACRQHSCDEKSSYITNGKHDLFGIISYHCTLSDGTVKFCSSGLLVIFYQDDEAKKRLSNYLIEWKAKVAPKADVVYESVN